MPASLAIAMALRRNGTAISALSSISSSSEVNSYSVIEVPILFLFVALDARHGFFMNSGFSWALGNRRG